VLGTGESIDGLLHELIGVDSWALTKDLDPGICRAEAGTAYEVGNDWVEYNEWSEVILRYLVSIINIQCKKSIGEVFHHQMLHAGVFNHSSPLKLTEPRKKFLGQLL